MSLNLLGLGMVFEATDHASHVIHEIEHKIEHMAHETGVHVHHMDDSFKGLGTGLGALLVGFEGLEKTFELAETAAHDEQAMLKLATTTHLTAGQLEHLKQAAIEATDHTKFTSLEGVNALHNLMRQGFDATEAVQLLHPALLLAADSLGELNTEAAATGLARVMKSYGIEATDAGLAVDQMVKGIQDLGLQAGTLPDALRLADRGARAMNQSMTEVLMTVGLAKDVFGSQTRAAAMLGKEMAGMANPKTQADLAALGKGISVFDKSGQFRPFLDVVADIGGELSKMSEANRSAWLEKTFGEAPAVGVLIDELGKRVHDTSGNLLKGAEAATFLRESLRNVAPVAEHTNHVLESGFEGGIEAIEKMHHELTDELGTAFLNVFKPALHLVARAMDGLLNIIRATPMPVKVAAAAITVGALAVTMLTGALMLFYHGWPLVKAGLMILKASFYEFAAAAWASIVPMLPWIVGAAAVAGVVYMIHENVLGLGDAWEWLKGLWDAPLIRAVGEALLFAGGAFLLFSNAMAIAELIEGVTTAFWAFNVALWANPLTWVVAGLIAIGLAITAIQTNWKGLGDDFHNGVDEIKKKLSEWFAWFKPIADALEHAWTAANKFFGVSADKKPKEVDDFETGIYSLTKTERGMHGAVIGIGEYAKKAAEEGHGEGHGDHEGEGANVHEPGGHTAGMANLHDAGGMGSEQLQQVLAEAAKGTQHEAHGAAIDYDKLSKAVSAQPIHAVFDVDGERMAEVVAHAQRDSAARSSHAVGPE